MSCRSRLSMLLCLILFPRGLALVLIGKPASQSYWTDPNTSPDKAIDGDVNTIQHTSGCTGEQWWMVDLQAIYCLTKITIVNRRDHGGWRLAGAVVRAGLDPSDFSQNTRIGSVSSSQATTGAVIDFMVDPVVSAQYVSVQLNGNGIRNKCLHMAEVRVEEIRDNEDTSSVAGRVDVTLVASSAVLGPTGNNSATLAAYKSPTDIAAAVSFGRQLTTGGSNDHLPTGAVGFYDPSLGCKARLLSLPEAGGIDRTGVFYSTATRNGVMTKIQTLILPTDDIVYTRPLQRTQAASIGESITLQMEEVNSLNTNYRWKHNRNDVPIGNDMLSVSIVSVTQADEGIYSCFADGQENQQQHGFMRLIVRECAYGTWGPPSCESVCRRCYNGGICDDITGRCVCAPGFSGEYCEQVHGRHVFGQNASHNCSDSPDPHNDACQGRLFCLPDPYGCSCAAGFTGIDCMQGCNGGMFGADCKQTCHCASGDLCEEDTGKCAGNCVDPYFGENCQCATTNAVLGLDVISNDPYELRVSWLPDPCVPGYSLEYTLTNRGQCEVIKSPQPVIVPDLLDDQTTSHVITGLEAHSTYTVSLRPTYTGTQGPDVSTSVTTLLETNPSVSPVIITSYDSVSVTLSWREVNCANYSVEYALLNKEGCQPISPIIFLLHCMCSGTNVTVISDLMANSMYRMRVKAFVDGNHGSAEEKDVTTSTREPSASPANVTLLVRNKRQLSFSWSPPPCGSRGGIITGYVYKLSGRGPTILDDTAVESVTITQLIPFTNYKFQVAAKTNAGAGPYSETITGKTLEAVPTAPVNVAIQNVDDVSITVKWSEPDPPQGIITHYNVRYWKSGQTGSQTDEDVVLLVHRIPGLETNVTYTIQVQAETSVGVGPWSLDVTTTTRIGEPGPVQELHWTDRTDSTITLDWEPPISPNGQIRKYIVEYRALEKSHQPSFTPSDEYIRNEVVSAPYQKENLEPATKYDFKVSAENQLFIGFGTSLEIFTKPKTDLPAPPQPISFPDDSTDTTVTIGLTLAISGDDFTESYVVRVKKTRSSSVTKRDVLIPSHFEDSPDDYIAADLLKGGVPDRFVVGDAKLYGGYYNAPLQRGAVYNIRVGSVSRGNETEANVVYSEPLTVKVEQSSSSVGPVIAAVVLAIVLFIVVGIAAFIYWKKRRTPSPPPATTELKVLSETSKAKIRNIGSSSESNTLNPDVDVYEDIGLLPSWAAQMEIRWENLVVEDVILGKGNFGEVRAGGVKMDGNVIKAAIKTLKESASETVLDDFKTELQTMTGIKPHPNVVCLLGACLHEGILYVALEFLPNGNLRDYLRKTRPNQQGSADSKDDVSPLTSKNLLNFGLDVAKGMEHLSNTGIIHRDLAARNILLSENLTAKVSDFGLSRGEDVYVQKSSTRIPVRWLAIESLTRRVYKTKSDVWSFGILLWEIATYGSTPYPGIESKSLAKRLLDGYRMPKPENCADELYNLMLRCWQEEPNDRPNFGNLVQILEEVCLVSDADIYLSPTVYQNFIIKREFDDK